MIVAAEFHFVNDTLVIADWCIRADESSGLFGRCEDYQFQSRHRVQIAQLSVHEPTVEASSCVLHEPRIVEAPRVFLDHIHVVLLERGSASLVLASALCELGTVKVTVDLDGATGIGPSISVRAWRSATQY